MNEERKIIEKARCIECPYCGRKNPAGAKKCEGCGRTL